MYKWIVTALLSLAGAILIIDRYILFLFIDQIKHDLVLSDTDISLIIGLSFSLFYSGFGILFGRMADRSNRRDLVVAAVAIWSAMAVMAGLSRNLRDFFIARMASAAGESALTPASYSLVSDVFPSEELHRAISMVYLGTAVAPGLAMVIGAGAYALIVELAKFGGIWSAVYPWQAVLISVGVAGVLFACILRYAVKEPVRNHREPEPDDPISDREFLQWLWRSRSTFLAVFTGITLLSCNFLAILTWISPFFQRTFDWTPDRAGALLGAPLSFCGLFGALIGGAVAQSLSRRRSGDQTLRAMLVFSILCAPLTIGATVSTSPMIASVLFCGAFLMFMASFAIAPAFIQVATPSRMRGRISASYMILLTLVPPSVGPLAVSIMTDFVLRDESKVGVAMTAAACFFLPVSILCFAKAAGRTITHTAKKGLE